MRELRSEAWSDSRADAVVTRGLGKRYGSVRALQDCTVSIPEGSVTALIGPNGAGKTTLLQLLAGLSRPGAGEMWVLGRRPVQSVEFLADVGFLAQEAPLYRRLDAEDHLAMGAHLNPRWDAALARDRLARLRVPMDRAVGTLSGGQRAQVALAMALAKRPHLLLLDEPVAALDPLARREFLASLTEAVAEGGLTVVISSHLLLDLERVCDHLVLLNASRTQLCDRIDTLLADHRVLVGRRQSTTAIGRAHTVVSVLHTPRETTAVVRLSGPVLDPGWEASDISLEELVVAYMAQDASAPGGRWRWPGRPDELDDLAAASKPGVLRGGEPRGDHGVPARHRIHLTGVYHQALATCGLTHTCRDLANELFQGDNWLWDLAMLAIVVPALFGIFWGVPLVAREVEEATHKLAWTQSVPRRRWLGANLGWILFAAAAWGAGFAALLTWWLGPENGLKLERFQPVHFDIQGIVPVAYAVFAVALGIAAGAWFRRVLPAAAATLGGFVLVRFVIQHFARPHYLHPVTSGLPLNGEVGVSGPSAGSWILSHGVIVDAAGRPLALPPTLKELPAACRGTFPGGARNLFDCLSNHGYRVIATYQPAGRFWTFQAIESAIFIVLAGILVALAAWRVLTADA